MMLCLAAMLQKSYNAAGSGQSSYSPCLTSLILLKNHVRTPSQRALMQTSFSVNIFFKYMVAPLYIYIWLSPRLAKKGLEIDTELQKSTNQITEVNTRGIVGGFQRK